MKKISIILLALCLILTTALQAKPVKALSSETIDFTIAFRDEKLPSNASKIIRDLGGEIVYSVPEIGVVQVKAPANFAKLAARNTAILAANPALKYELPLVKTVKSADTSII
jgi:lantibiotic leader peptide-processing serine protease